MVVVQFNIWLLLIDVVFGRLVEYQTNGLGVYCLWCGIIRLGLKGNVNLRLMFWASWTRLFCQSGMFKAKIYIACYIYVQYELQCFVEVSVY